uniref:Maltase n=1 Tax=Ascaris suum TaxID=6253 RepID=F1KPW3_ASCSU
MLGMTKAGRIYDTKSLYGFFESIATRAGMEAATSKRPAVITRSSFPSGGRYAGHWLGDNLAAWGDLLVSVVGIQEFSIFGIPYVGADICGFRGNTTEELCLRWHQLGAFYTFSRNHNDIGQVRQDPAAWPSVAAATRQVYLFRYSYLPYLYTLHYLAATTGSTVVRPLFFEFPNDEAAHANHEQFMWGEAMLIAPVLRQRSEEVYAYLPQAAVWYSLRDGDYGVKIGSGFTFLSAPLDQLPPVLIRGGCIVPRQAPEMTTIASRKNPLELVIALNEKGEASGSLFWDDGESPLTSNCCNIYQFKFRVNITHAEFTVTGNSANRTIPPLNVIEIFGYDRTPYLGSAKVNGYPRPLIHCASYDSVRKLISINCTDLLNITTVGKSIIWSNTYSESEAVDPDKRIDCLPGSTTGSLSGSCARVGCFYDPYSDYGIPACYYPRRSGYIKKDATTDGVLLESHPAVANPYGDNISPIFFRYSRIGSTLNIRIGPEGRYEPPLNLPRESYDTGEEFVVQQTTETGVFAFKVKRPSANESIWDTTIGGLMFADQYIQIAAFIGSSGIYGLGEHAKYRLMHAMDNYETWPMFSRDQFPSSSTSNQNLYGAYPFYIAVEKDYKAHGVLIVNSNAQELMIGPAPHIVYRTIGGMLDIYFFPGPRPEDVVRQYAALVGKPAFPPYWGFGYQLCKYGYKSLAELKETISAVQKAGIPLDVVYADIDHMDLYQDFTLGQNWTELPTYIKQLHDQSMHAILIFDPAIQVDSESFQRGISASAKFVEWERNDQVPRAIQDLYPLVSNTKIMLGTVWPLKHVAFPDFTAAETREWWKNEIVRFHAQVGFDGMWIDMNEPTNIGTNENDTQPITPNHSDRPYIAPLMCPLNGSDSTYDMPPYETYNVFVYEKGTVKSYLSSKTLCMLGMTKAGRIYDTKSLYGFFESIATRAGMEAATSKRPAVITRSSFPSGGRYAGHWLGDNLAAWGDLLVSVVGIQEFSIFGIPYVGADICGFRGDTTEELCLRWHQLGAFYTFSRNHNDIGQVRQDPAAWPSVAAATRQVYLFRYRYLPYLYTLHYLAATTGSTVVRPLFFEFPNDEAAHANHEQFMWGEAMLIAPVLRQGAKEVYAYLPREATWYSLRDTDYGVKTGSGFTFLSAPLDQLPPVLIRGGCIIPRQAPEMTTIASRKNPLELVIALNGTDEASGTLFWDDGESPITPNCCSVYQFKLRVSATSTEFTVTGYSANITIPSLNVIDILGYDRTPNFETAVVNGIPRSLSECASYDSTKQIVSINCTNLLDISSVGKSISWSNTYSETVDPDKRVECFPAPGTTQLESRCAQVGCIYDRLPEFGIPACYFPPKSGYVKTGTTSDGVVLESYRPVSNPYGDNISPIFFKYSRIGSTLNIRIGPEGRYEPPLNLPRSLVDCSTYNPVMHIVYINCTDLLDISSVGKSIVWSNMYSEVVDQDKRIDCLPAPTTDSLVNRCAQVGCIYDYWADYGIPECYFPRRSGYIIKGTTTDGVVLESYPGVSNPYGDNISPIFFKYSQIGSTVNIRIGPEGRYEPQLSLPRESYDTGEELVVQQTTETGVFAFKVKRPSANESIWDTTIGGLMFADQYIQIAAFIGSSEIFGLGEHTRSRLRHATNTYATWPMFARDQFPSSSTSNQNLYGVYPFYIAIENDHKAHGVLILNSNAQELMIGPAPHIVYRTIGGMLDIYFFPGHRPEDVVRQYAALVGKPAFPPYWGFGYQLCKYGYKSLAELKETISAVQEAGVPLDVVYADIDHMDLYQDFTLGQNWTELPTYVKQLHDQSMHAILIFDPAIQVDSESFQRGINASAKFVEWERNDQVPRAIQDLYPLVSNTKIMLGTVWPLKHVAFPDFSAPETQEWWKNEIVRFHAEVGFDGMWIDMNEPTNIGTNENDTQPITPNHSDRPYIAPLMCPLNGSDSTYDMPPYETYNVFVYEHDAEKSYLSSKTLCMLGVTRAGRIYDTKSLYGFYESIATRAGMEAATSKRPLVLTRSSFPSGGRYAGHWLGDNSATWEDLHESVVGIQDFSMFGIPYVGADICGFRGNTTAALCLRWHQLGAFYTFSRNHNDIGQIRQDPAAWPTVADATRQVYLFRYRYLPYLYTLHYLAATSGSTVVRPVFFEFPNDDAARENNEQFMWGDAMLIAPVLREQWEVVYAYLPREATWYSLRDTDYGVKAGPGFTFLNAPLDQLPPVLIRGGYIIPRQAPELTTMASRRNPLELVIAVNENYEASGSLFWDDGESPVTANCCNTYQFDLRINSSSTVLTVTAFSAGLKVPALNIIDIFGYDRVPSFESAVVNGASYSLSRCASYDATRQIVSINCPNLLDISNVGGSISWSNGPPVITTPTGEPQTATTSPVRQTTSSTTRSSSAAVTTPETPATTSGGTKIASSLMSALLLNSIAAVLLCHII